VVTDSDCYQRIIIFQGLFVLKGVNQMRPI
jgi:hypothetical protein